MLANGIKLGYKTLAETVFTDLIGLQEVPELGMDPEKVEITTLADTAKQYEFGVGDYGDLEFTFLYNNSTATSPYRLLREFGEDKTVLDFQMTMPDGTKFAWKAMVNVKLSGGGVNAPITFKLTMALQSKITPTDPS